MATAKVSYANAAAKKMQPSELAVKKIHDPYSLDGIAEKLAENCIVRFRRAGSDVIYYLDIMPNCFFTNCFKICTCEPLFCSDILEHSHSLTGSDADCQKCKSLKSVFWNQALLMKRRPQLIFQEEGRNYAKQLFKGHDIEQFMPKDTFYYQKLYSPLFGGHCPIMFKTLQVIQDEDCEKVLEEK